MTYYIYIFAIALHVVPSAFSLQPSVLQPSVLQSSVLQLRPSQFTVTVTLHVCTAYTDRLLVITCVLTSEDSTTLLSIYAYIEIYTLELEWPL